MEETTHQLIITLIKHELKPIEARLDILEAETHRLERNVAEMQNRIDELEEEQTDTDVDIINNIEETELDESMLEHLMNDPLRKHTIQKNATHISLTIDLSKKNK